MIRTGYLRWEIEARDEPKPGDAWSRRLVFLARPTYRRVRVLWSDLSTVQEQFAQGQATYAAVLRAGDQKGQASVVNLPDVGPRVFTYAASDRDKMPRYWWEKVKREADAFAHEIVREASEFRELLVTNPLLRARYADMVRGEVLRVAQGISQPRPTNEDEVPEIDLRRHGEGLPELVAAELVRDVMEPKHFEQFCNKNLVRVAAGNKIYEIPRATHGLIRVWENRKPLCRLCVVFQDPGMPPSDEVVMKYLLVRHQPDELWRVANRFGFDGPVVPEGELAAV